MSGSEQQPPTCNQRKRRRRRAVSAFLVCGSNEDGRLGLRPEFANSNFFARIKHESFQRRGRRACASDEGSERSDCDFEDKGSVWSSSSSFSSWSESESNSVCSEREGRFSPRQCCGEYQSQSTQSRSLENVAHERKIQSVGEYQSRSTPSRSLEHFARERKGSRSDPMEIPVRRTGGVARQKGMKFRGEQRTRAISISCGSAHSMCCISDGSLYSWGSNSCGQLGIGVEGLSSASATTESRNEDAPWASVWEPTLVRFPKGDEPIPISCALPLQPSPRQRHFSTQVSVRSVACGSFHTLIVSSLGYLYSFGCNRHGALGVGDTVDRSSPTLVSAFSALKTTDGGRKCGRTVIVGAAGGLSHTLALSLGGEVYSFGRGAEGQLGDGLSGTGIDQDYRRLDLNHSASWDSSIVDVGAFEMEDVGDEALFSSMESHRNLKKEEVRREAESQDAENEVHCHCSLTPKKVYGMLESNPVIMLACSQGGHGSYAVTAIDGHGWRWGLMDKELSTTEASISSSTSHINVSVDRIVTLPIPLPAPLGSESVSDSSVPVSNVEPVTTSSPVPSASGGGIAQQQTLPASKNDQIVAFSAGARHLVCVTRAGEAWAMGAPGPHLGLGPGCEFEWIHSAARIPLPGDILVNGVSCGEYHTLLSTSSGRVFSCGDVSHGKLGLGDPEGDVIPNASSQLDAALGVADISIPKVVTFGLLRKSQYRKDSLSRVGKTAAQMDNDEVFCSTTVGDFVFAREAVFQHLRKKHEEAKKREAALAEESQTPYAIVREESFEDDEDYWGKEGLGYELEMDFASTGPPFGSGRSSWNLGVSELSSSLKQRLSEETRRRISNSTRAVGGVLLTGSAKLSGIVSAVKSGMQTGSGEQSSSSSKSIAESGVRSKLSDGAKVREAVVVGSMGSHQDSFDGLAGKATRSIMMAAGASHSFLHVLDKSL